MKVEISHDAEIEAHRNELHVLSRGSSQRLDFPGLHSSDIQFRIIEGG